jgi:hypothetical protein
MYLPCFLENRDRRNIWHTDERITKAAFIIALDKAGGVLK